MDEPVFSRSNWWPSALRRDGELVLEVVGGAGPLHDPRTFTVPIREEHLQVLRDDVRRHLLLYAALLPVCYQAGSVGPWDEAAAAALLDPILLGAPDEVDAALSQTGVIRRTLIAHHASVPLLNRGKFFEAAQSATVQSDWARARKYEGV